MHIRAFAGLFAATAACSAPLAAESASPDSEWISVDQVTLEAAVEDHFHQSLTWSPDGAKIAYVEFIGSPMDPNNRILRIVDVAGGEPQSLATNAIGAEWSPHPNVVAFARDVDGANEVFAVDVENGKETRITDTPDVGETGFAWTADGARTAFTNGAARAYALTIADADFADLQTMTDDEAKYFGPSWSADGATLAYFREIGDGKDQVWVRALDADAPRQVTNGGGHNLYPQFAGDGTLIYVSGRPDNKGEDRFLVRATIDGEPLNEIRVDGLRFARLSPDGSRVAVVAGAFPRSAIHVIDLVTGEARKIVN